MRNYNTRTWAAGKAPPVTNPKYLQNRGKFNNKTQGMQVKEKGATRE